MKSALVIFVFALSFLECEQLLSGPLTGLGCTRTIRKRNAYENLFTTEKVMITAQYDCKNRMATGLADEPDNTRRFNPASPCDTGVPDTNPGGLINVYVNPPPGVSSPRPGENGRAFYLIQEDNKNTYMILDAAQAHWFFTNPLSGCDMFVATHPNHPQKPLLIHANRNAVGGAGAAQYQTNFDLKQTSTDTIIRNNVGYVLRARLHPNRDGMVDYWNAYDAAHPSVSRMAYFQPGRVSQSYTFFGFYNPETESWTFKYKGEIDGIVDDVFVHHT